MRGRFAYTCEDCNERTFLSAKDRSSRFRPRCNFCGSLHLSPTKSSVAHKRMDTFSSVKAEQVDKMKKIMNKK